MNSFRILGLILLLFSCSFLSAQELMVKSFALASNEIISSQDQRLDFTGKPYALLKIQMLDQLEKVEGSVKKDEIVDRGTEKWVYVVDGTYQLRIYPKNHLPIDFNIKGYKYDYFESNRVYVLRLMDDKSVPNSPLSDRAYLKLFLSPKDALVSIDGQSSDVDPEEGSLSEVLKFGRHILVVQARGYVTHTDTIDFRQEQTLNITLTRRENPTVTIRSTTSGATIYVNDVKRGTGECKLQLSPRDYIVRVECEGYETLQEPITVTDSPEQQFDIPAMKQLLGSLNVNFKPTGSILFVDGQQRGTTPTIVGELSVGAHKVVINKEGYNTYTNNNVMVEPNVENTISGKLEKTVKVKVQEIATANKSSDDGLMPTTCVYGNMACQGGTLLGIGAAAGVYISSFNVEASYLMGLTMSEDIFWNKGDVPSVLCSYKPTALGFRVGYGIAAGKSFRLTPQVGVTAVNIKCSDGDSKGNAMPATLGLRADYAFAPHFIIFATPEASFVVSKSDVYQQLMDVSSKIKSWVQGFNLRMGLCVYF